MIDIMSYRKIFTYFLEVGLNISQLSIGPFFELLRQLKPIETCL